MRRTKITKRSTRRTAKPAATLESVLELLNKVVDAEIENFSDGYIKIELNGGISVGNDYGDWEYCSSFAEAQTYLESLLKENQFETTQVGTYEAKVYSDRIEVGCQTVTFEQLDELNKVVKKVKGK